MTRHHALKFLEIVSFLESVQWILQLQQAELDLLVHVVDVSKDHDQVTRSDQNQDMSRIPAGKPTSR